MTTVFTRPNRLVSDLRSNEPPAGSPTGSAVPAIGDVAR